LTRRRAAYVIFGISLGVLLLAVACTAGCGARANRAPGVTGGERSSLEVVAVETFLADIAQNVAGDIVQVQALMPVGAEPHGFEPTPADAARVAQCDVLIVNGAGLEASLEKMLGSVAGPSHVIEASAGLVSRAAREGEEATPTDADLADAICSAARQGHAVPVTAGATVAEAAALPAVAGVFDVALTPQGDGTYAGYLSYVTDESGDFQFAFGRGELAVQPKEGGAAPTEKRRLTLECAGVSHGLIVELGAASYTLALSRFESERVTLLVGPAEQPHHHDQEDPHFWLDPLLVVKYAQNIRDGLAEADPPHATSYAANAQTYIESLVALDGWIKQQVAEIPASQRLLVTNHESFGYFADRYGFRVVGTIMPSVSEVGSPSAEQLKRLIQTIRQTGARAIFLETGANTQLADQVAAETGVKVVTGLYTHSLSEPDGPAPTYIDMMRFNTRAIVEALK
jgi:manganese/iron transport system substrate-binding protein